MEAAVVCGGIHSSGGTVRVDSESNRRRTVDCRCEDTSHSVRTAGIPMDRPISENTAAAEMADRMVERISTCAGALTALTLFALLWVAGRSFLPLDTAIQVLPETAEPNHCEFARSAPPPQPPDRSEPAALSAAWHGRALFRNAKIRQSVSGVCGTRQDRLALAASFEPGPASNLVAPPCDTSFMETDPALPPPQKPVPCHRQADFAVGCSPHSAEQNGESLTTVCVTAFSLEATVFSMSLLHEPADTLPPFPSRPGVMAWYQPGQVPGDMSAAPASQEEGIGSLTDVSVESHIVPCHRTWEWSGDSPDWISPCEVFGEVDREWTRTISGISFDRGERSGPDQWFSQLTAIPPSEVAPNRRVSPFEAGRNY